MQKMIFRLRKKAFSPIFAATVKMTLLWKNSIIFLWIFETKLSLTGAARVVFGVFSPGRTQCIAPKKLPDKAMSIWNLHKKFQLSSAMGLRDFDLQSQPTLMGGNPLIVVHWLYITKPDLWEKWPNLSLNRTRLEPHYIFLICRHKYVRKVSFVCHSICQSLGWTSSNFHHRNGTNKRYILLNLSHK